MKELKDLLYAVSQLSYDFENLGWETDGRPDSDKCMDFSYVLESLEETARKILEELKN